MFFQSPPLSDGEHTLLVTNLGTGALWIDYIIYTPSAPPTSSSLPPSTLPLSPTLTSSQIVSVTPSDKPVINSPTSEPSSTGDNSSGTGAPSQDNSNSKSSIPAAAVAGGAIGALILIIALVFGMLYYRKRARRLAGTRSLEKEHVLGGKITTRVSLHVPNSNLMPVPQIPQSLTRLTLVLSSHPSRAHIPTAPTPLPATGAPT